MSALPPDFPHDRANHSLLVSLVIIGMGFTVLFPILAPLGREIGLSEVQINAIIAASSLTVFLASPHWGRLSDRLGRKNTLLIGLFGFSFGTLLFNGVLAAGMTGALLGAPLFVALVVARVTHAGVMSATMPSVNAYIADITSPAERTRRMGAAGAANNLGSILGPAAAMLAVVSLLTPLWLMAALAFLNGLFLWRFLPEPPQADRKATPRMAYTDARILPFVLVGVSMFTGIALVQQTMGFRFQDALTLSTAETAQMVGIAMTLSAVCSLTAQLTIVQRSRLQPFTLLTLAMPMLIVAFVMMALGTTQVLLTAAMMVQGFAMGLAGPGFTAGASLSVGPDEQGAVAGVAASCGPLGFCIGPLIGGFLYQLEPTLPYAVVAAGYVILFLFMRRLRQRVRVHET
ncbi:MAG: MFS transporter [Pseudomonadota bacterium]